MRRIILILIFITTLVNAQKILFDKKDNPELNTNTSLDFVYTDVAQTGDMSSTTSWAFSGAGATITGGALVLSPAVSANPYGINALSAAIHSGAALVIYTVQSNTIDGALRFYVFSNTVNGSSYSPPSTVGTHLYVVKADGTGADNDFDFRVTGSTTGSIAISEYSISQVIAPTGFVIPTFTATDYVIENNGCQFIEATGDTYIEMTDTLAAGYYYVTATQNYTSGELNAYNGTSEVAFPQVSGTSKKLVQLDGVHPLRLQVDNNSNITVTKLSIKRK